MCLALQGSQGSFLCEFAAEGKIKKKTPSFIYLFTFFSVHLYFLWWFVFFFEEQSSVKLLFVTWHLRASLILLRSLSNDFLFFFSTLRAHFNVSQPLDSETVSDFTLQPLQKQQHSRTCSCRSGFSPTSGKTSFFSCPFIKKFTGNNIQDLCPAENLSFRQPPPSTLWVSYLVTEHLMVMWKKKRGCIDGGCRVKRHIIHCKLMQGRKQMNWGSMQ